MVWVFLLLSKTDDQISGLKSVNKPRPTNLPNADDIPSPRDTNRWPLITLPRGDSGRLRLLARGTPRGILVLLFFFSYKTAINFVPHSHTSSTAPTPLFMFFLQSDLLPPATTLLHISSLFYTFLPPFHRKVHTHTS